jgi:hypothetical protein
MVLKIRFAVVDAHHEQTLSSFGIRLFGGDLRQG